MNRTMIGLPGRISGAILSQQPVPKSSCPGNAVCGTEEDRLTLTTIKGLLAVPFILHSQPTAAYDTRSDVLMTMATTAHRRYAEILHDVEDLINDHIAHQRHGTHERSKLKLLVPSVGRFFTPLLLEKAFAFQDARRRISSRRFVPPSFNDIRLTMNTAQVMSTSDFKSFLPWWHRCRCPQKNT